MDQKKFKQIIKEGGYDNSILPTAGEVLKMMSQYEAISKSKYDALPSKERLEVYSRDRILYFTMRENGN